jgi:DNA-binding NarL/FixJ family response regulator
MDSLRILIVDDHEAILRGVRSVLASRTDWLVCGEARDGVEAVEKVKSMRPDLVLMDISMPRMEGVQATRIIRREFPESQVVIVSQNDPKLVARQAAEVDASGYVAKSDLSHQLLPTIDRVLAERNARKRSKVQQSQPCSNVASGKQAEGKQ